MTVLHKIAQGLGASASPLWGGSASLLRREPGWRSRAESAGRWNIGPQGRSGVWLPGTRGSESETGAGGLPPDALKGMRVLLVDDSPETLEAFRMLLEIEGASVSIATGGLAALAVSEHESFDLILSDIGMPGMDGYELIARLRARESTADIPAFALSGFGDRAGIERALRAGFQAYIDKPVTLDDLLHAMARTQVGLSARRET